jgi:tetratricopeptide (TPR) repeat protein
MQDNHPPVMGPAPSAAPSQLNRVIVAALLLICLTAAGGFWWMCARSDKIPFLPARAGAEWIVFPKQAEGTQHDALPVTAAFRHSFTFTGQPATVTLSVCAFKGAIIAINNRVVGNTPWPHRNWKLPSCTEVAGLLQPGTNVITAWVTNAIGPPALWLLLKSPQFSLGTGERWQVSLNGTEWQSARRARQPPDLPPDSPLYGSARMMDLLKRVWPLEAAFCVLSLALIWGINRWLRHQRLPAGTLPTATSTKLVYGLLVTVLMARAALFINNLPQLPRSAGFDAIAHEQYIQFIQQKHALPLADDGWEMYQPPLYYLTSALVLEGFGRSVGDAQAVYFLRAVNGVIGLLHCWVVLLCLRLLFWGNIQAQAAGLLVTAFLPPHLYLSQYVTNEPLAGFLVTVAIYLCLRALRSEKTSIWMPVGIGAALGAAMLTKFSVLLALPVFPVVLSQRRAARKERAWRDWTLSVATVFATFLIVCGGHYGRVWARFGKPIVGNWDALSGQEGPGQWWLEPGFGTSAFYSGFGRSLISPSFSGFHSFADGIYSTLWGDGLASGAADLRALRPPWNYDLAVAGYWTSLGISLLLTIGAALVLARIMRQARGEWLLVLGIVGSFSLGLLWINLVLPYCTQAKAFYAFPALLPFSALVAAGWDWLRQRGRAIGIAVWVLLLVWSMTSYTSFWVRSANPATQLVRNTELGAALLRQGKLDEAIDQYQEAIRLKPDYANAHNNLGIALARKGQTDEAIRQYREALRLKPDHADAHNGLGVALHEKGQMDEAVRHLQEALRLKPDHGDAHYNLGVAFYQQGRTAEAIRQFQEVIRLKPDHAEAHNNLGTAFGLGGQTAEATRQFREALRLKPDYAAARNNLDAVLGLKTNSTPPPGAVTNR